MTAAGPSARCERSQRRHCDGACSCADGWLWMALAGAHWRADLHGTVRAGPLSCAASLQPCLASSVLPLSPSQARGSQAGWGPQRLPMRRCTADGSVRQGTSGCESVQHKAQKPHNGKRLVLHQEEHGWGRTKAASLRRSSGHWSVGRLGCAQAQ